MTAKTKSVLLIFCLTLIIYSNSLGGEFIYDDEYFIVKNINIRNFGNISSLFFNPAAVAFAELARDVYRPLTTFSYMIDYFLWRLDTFGYHLVNVLFHSFNAILLFLFLFAMFGEIELALLTSLIFAIHPVQTEVVSWISGRSSVLFLFFYLAALLFYVRFLRESKKIYFVLSVLLYLFSLLSKEMAVTLPLLLIACDAHFFNKDGLRKKIYRYLPYFFMTFLFLALRYHVLGRMSQCGWWGGSPYYTFLTMSWVIMEYIKLMLIPVKLCAFYVLDVSRTAAETKVILSIAALVAIFSILPVIFRRSRKASFAIWFFFITILPVSNIVPLRALMAERFLYLPLIGFSMLMALFIENIGSISSKNRKVVVVSAASILIAAYSFRTMERNRDWRDSVTISRRIIELYPLNPWGLTSLSTSYLDKKMYDDAVKSARKAIAVSPYYAPPWHALGFCYLEMERYGDAIRILNQALKLEPRNLETMNSLGVAYGKTKRYDDAVKLFEQSIAVDPTFVTAYLNLGTTYEFKGEYDKAIEEYRKIGVKTRSAQDIAISYVRIGDVYIKLKDKKEAQRYYGKALDACGSGFEELKKVVRDRLATKWVDK